MTATQAGLYGLLLRPLDPDTFGSWSRAARRPIHLVDLPRRSQTKE